MPKPKVIVVSGSDDAFVPLARDLFTSIRDHSYKYEFDLGLLDIGLSDDNRAGFEKQNIRVEKVRAEGDIDYPARRIWEAERPACKVFTAKPFLPRYFPGYDIYLWLDADIWVQTHDAIDALIEGSAESNALHIAMEFDRCYSLFFQKPQVWHMYHEWYQACFNDDNVTAHMTLKPMLNVGVFAMSKNAPVWNAWQKIYADILQRTPQLNSKTIMLEQLALNVAVYMMNLPYVPMPASYNWLTVLAMPMLDKKTGMYVEPLPPHAPISQFHLTHKPKEQAQKIACIGGGFIERPLLYSARNT